MNIFVRRPQPKAPRAPKVRLPTLPKIAQRGGLVRHLTNSKIRERLRVELARSGHSIDAGFRKNSQLAALVLASIKTLTWAREFHPDRPDVARLEALIRALGARLQPQHFVKLLQRQQRLATAWAAVEARLDTLYRVARPTDHQANTAEGENNP